MKVYSTLLFTIILFLSCNETGYIENPIFPAVKNCDELEIVCYTKDTFELKTTDTSLINFFGEFITGKDESITDSCEPTGELIFKQKGKEIFKADMATVNVPDSISCEYVTYYVNSKRIRQKMTYRKGMAIDEIYGERNDPQEYPSSGKLDTSITKYEDFKKQE